MKYMLRAVGGLTPEATMAQRIGRAKQRVKDKSFSVQLERLPVVLDVLDLVFNEGYTASSPRARARRSSPARRSGSRASPTGSFPMTPSWRACSR